MTIAAVGTALSVCALVLWESSVVPGDLRLPRVDASDVAAADVIDDARHSETIADLIGLGDLVVPILAALLFVRVGPGFVRQSAAGRIGTGMLLGMLGFGVVWLASLPTGILGHWWARHEDASDMGYVTWLLQSWMELVPTFLVVCLAVLVTMLLARPFPRTWWIPAAPVLAALVLLVSFLTPYLVIGQRAPSSLDGTERYLVADARALARDEGLPRVPVRVQDVDEETSAPNAMTAGIGPTRRVIMWNTLLQSFERDEVRVVLAHELAHQGRSHILKQVAWFALLALPLAWVVALFTRRRGGLYHPEAVPLGILAFTVLTVAVLPLQNVVSRHMEREADWVALQATRDPEAARGLFRGFTTLAGSDPSPPSWSYVLYGSHPTVVQRLAMVDAWESRRSGGG